MGVLGRSHDTFTDVTKLVEECGLVDSYYDVINRFSYNGTDPLPGPMPEDEMLDQTDALLVDAIHTDSDNFEIVPSVGHVDFYLGKTLPDLESDQSWCNSSIFDHGRSHDVMRASIAAGRILSVQETLWKEDAPQPLPCKPCPQDPTLATGMMEQLQPRTMVWCLDDNMCAAGEECEATSHACKPNSVQH